VRTSTVPVTETLREGQREGLILKAIAPICDVPADTLREVARLPKQGAMILGHGHQPARAPITLRLIALVTVWPSASPVRLHPAAQAKQ
jgi:hypothetical protein